MTALAEQADVMLVYEMKLGHVCGVFAYCWFCMFGLGWRFRRQVKKTVRTALYVAETKTKLTETVVTEVKTESAVAQEIISCKCHVIDGDTIAIGRQQDTPCWYRRTRVAQSIR